MEHKTSSDGTTVIILIINVIIITISSIYFILLLFLLDQRQVEYSASQPKIGDIDVLGPGGMIHRRFGCVPLP
jgi:hypothetical protein